VTGKEDGKLLKLNRTSRRAQNFACLYQDEGGNMSFSILWHARYGHINYGSLCLLKKNGVFGFPTIPRKLMQCDACILGKHSKYAFHDSNFKACRKLELIHSDLCGFMPVPSTNVNKYIMTFIDDNTKMCWVYVLKEKS